MGNDLTPSDTIILAELLCARLCHDLAGPVGAVATGAELLAEDDEDIGGEALSLMGTSAKAAGARLRYLRQAFGLSTTQIAAQSVRELANAYFAGPPLEMGGIKLVWDDQGMGPFAPREAKLVLNLLLLAQDCLPRGGVITARLRSKTEGVASVTAEGRTVAVGASLNGTGADCPSELNSREAQGYYTAQLVSALGLVLETLVETGYIRLKAR